MNVMFHPDVLLYNVFYKEQRKQKKTQISVSDKKLREYYRKLENRVFKITPYILWDGDLDKFCSESKDFMCGIDKFYCLNKIEEKTVLDINKIYPKFVQDILNDLFLK